MLWNGNLAYIFMPRTGSRSLNAHFAATWKGPLFGTASPAQLREIQARSHAPTFVRPGRGHENATQLRNYLYRHGRTLRQIKHLAFVVRNPYHLVLSNYHFLQGQAKEGVNSTSTTIAANSTFDEYCSKISHPDPANWLTLDGKIIENIHIMRFESLEKDVSDFDALINSKKIQFPHLNKAKTEAEYQGRYSKVSEQLVYEKYRILFELGHYTRGEGI